MYLRSFDEDSNAVYTSSTGKVQSEAPPGFEEALAANSGAAAAPADSDAAPTASLTATVLHDFEPQADGEGQVAVKAGDVVIFIEKSDGGWTGVKAGDLVGYVPSSYINMK